MILNIPTSTSKKHTVAHVLSLVALSTLLLINTAGAEDAVTSLEGLTDNSSSKTSTTKAKKEISSITEEATVACPLNSGGPSLLGTTWRLDTIYGNRVPRPIQLDMRITTHALSGFAGCNKYSASFSQVGYTGFRVIQIAKTKKPCKIIIPYKTAKAINIGNWEGSYLRTLRRMGSVRQITGDKLHFFNRNGEIGLTLSKIGDDTTPAVEEKAVVEKIPETASNETKAEASSEISTQKEETSDEKLIGSAAKALGL
ncbi:MAG: META domain-containing protein [Cocleimonas sp.]|nr:META domain-containing protein [Cocleimonas sp.]